MKITIYGKTNAEDFAVLRVGQVADTSELSIKHFIESETDEPFVDVSIDKGVENDKEICFHVVDNIDATHYLVKIDKEKPKEKVTTLQEDRKYNTATQIKVRQLLSEVNCRIEHGAESNGHLEYVQGKLRHILGLEHEIPIILKKRIYLTETGSNPPHATFLVDDKAETFKFDHVRVVSFIAACALNNPVEKAYKMAKASCTH